ncbi:ribosome hibernation-promoting factor, HPF/YfiA family [Hoeflea prorocentri]|uniref:Ribosome hibernation promoting factor n=1 Tax=Hoeflea prorocentri TaxID=1922333 RepID=A0A9X3UL33_9HYPH|nr:ribosome-associated translation inhibitor RaiA [Hoeflea prorocentri]MCY6382778.1 ribosome-associated translation inhibitor RaiA [Hoeflea prorocentri]MDA5400578.1 ribosome-associated translation inhibitor RaiA [Hoeflea prorocentri]
MSLRVSGKHMEIGETFRTRIEDRIGDAVTKYFDGGFSGQVTVEKSGSRFSTDCLVHLDTGASLQATGQAQEPQASFDAAAERVEKRLRRYKRRLKDHHAGNHANSAEVAYRVMDSGPQDEEEVPEDYAPAIVAESSKIIKTMTVAGAVMALDMTDNPVFVFRNAGNNEVNVVYRRNDGNIGWIDTADIKS